MAQWSAVRTFGDGHLDECTAAAKFLKRYLPPTWPEEAVQQEIIPPMLMGQARCALAEGNAVEALVAWAFVNDEVHAKLMTGSRGLLHVTEWNDGLNLWIIHAIPTKLTHLAEIKNIIREILCAHGKLYMQFSRHNRDYIIEADGHGGAVTLQLTLVNDSQ